MTYKAGKPRCLGLQDPFRNIRPKCQDSPLTEFIENLQVVGFELVDLIPNQLASWRVAHVVIDQIKHGLVHGDGRF